MVWGAANGQFDAVYGRRLTGSGTVTTTDSIVLSTQAANGEAAPDVVYLAAAGQYQAVWTKGNFGFENGDVYGRSLSIPHSGAGRDDAWVRASSVAHLPA